MDNSKKSLRKKYREIRKNISLKEEKDNRIFLKTIENEKIKSAKTILLYYSTKEEVDTISFIKYFLSIDKKVALPKTESNKIIFYYIENIEDVIVGKYHILEPISTNQVTNFSDSVCIVPGICFDLDNYRVGYGGGYYDRFLNNYSEYSIGITYQECITSKIEIDKYDKSVDIVITD